MQVIVKLFGTLPDHYPGDYPNSGLDVEVNTTTCVAELVELLQLPREQVAIVSINGRLAKAGDVLPDNSEVKVFQALHGG
ncbi:MAG: MoaD/ThiS family protein [Desulfobulbaceae bacterium]|nr:MoaD/ThiS family protein [Desulfobulbaceae bacterium]